LFVQNPLDLSPQNETSPKDQTKQYLVPLRTDDRSGSATIGEIRFHPGKNWVVIGGSVKGQGPAFGNKTLHDNVDDESWDGYISFLKSQDGQIIDNDMEIRPIRVQSTDKKDDFIHDICIDGDGLYVVGGSRGDLGGSKNTTGVEGGIFVQKYSLKLRKLLWHQRIPGAGIMDGVHCAISPVTTSGTDRNDQNNVLYVGGQTEIDLENGSELPAKDVFVRSYSTKSGTLLWSKQIDTSVLYGDIREDRIVSLETNPETPDIVVALANSMHFSSGTNDIVLFALSRKSGASLLDPHQTSSRPVTGVPSESDAGTNRRALIILSCAIPVLIVGILFVYQRKANHSSGISIRSSKSTNTTESMEPDRQQEEKESNFMNDNSNPPVESFVFFDSESYGAQEEVDPPPFSIV
jgi:hypothetical protein